jgi:tetratricopeptide (TPR) repeat protein
MLVVSSISALAQNVTTHVDDGQDIKKLFDEHRWLEVVARAQSVSPRSPDVNIWYGTALAQLSRWQEARHAFLDGFRSEPADKRFPTELAGVAFKRKRYREAKRWLHRALRLDSEDNYVNDFLGTVYFLEGNTEAALKYWNRVGKPQVENVRLDPEPRVRPELLDRAFAFAPASTLQLRDLLTTKARLTALGVFPTFSFELSAREEGNFDVLFHSAERNGFGVNRWQALLSTFSGVFYETVYPEYYNLNNSAINITSLLRWDEEKRRASADFSGPLWQDPKFRWHLGADLRNENWDLRAKFKGPAPVLGALNLRREAVSARFVELNSGRCNWSTAAEFSHRDYRSVFGGPTLTPGILLQGVQLKHIADISFDVWRVPEHRLDITSLAESELGAIWSTPRHTFEKVQGRIQAHWYPKARGDDYEMKGTIRAGKTVGQLPFDELFMLGLERDNELWLRAHIGTRDGRKGSSPLAKDYFLSNWEMDKNIYSNGLVGLKLGPFFDTGKAFRSLNEERNQWLYDTGVQAKFSVLGVGLVLTYGKDLRTGNNAFYLSAIRR